MLVTLDEATIDRLFAGAEGTEGYKLTVDLEKKVVIEPDGRETPFEFNEFRRQAIMKVSMMWASPFPQTLRRSESSKRSVSLRSPGL